MMSTFLILGGTAAVAAALIVYYYRNIGRREKRESDFNGEGRLHLIYPKS